MCAAPTVNVERKCPIVASKNFFFKSLTKIKLSDEGASQDISDHFRYATQGLTCSNKHGCILAAFQNLFVILREEDMWAAQLQAEASNAKMVDLSQVPHVKIQNTYLGSTPSTISVSYGEEFLAVDTVKHGQSFVIVFKLSSFLHQRGNCKPFCEIRGSTKSDTRIANICWNPGENLTNMVAISSSDGSLVLAKVNGENSIENWSLSGGVHTMCWSPKGKQLVVGKTDGNLNQLKLDLTEAKRIPGPGGCVPSSIFWNSTSQFVVVFDCSSEINVMVLDLVKGAPIQYTNYSDVFMSDTVSYPTRCFFLPVMDWKCIISIANSSNDVVLFGKTTEGDPWALLDIPDNKRPSLPIDNYSLGAAIYFSHKHNVVLSDSEQYSPMPVLYVLSQTGSLFSFLLINSDPEAQNIVTTVSDPIPDQVFAAQTNSVPQFMSPAAVPNVPTPIPVTNMQIPSMPTHTLKPVQTSSATSYIPQDTQPKLPEQFMQTSLRQSLPTAKELEKVKSILTERLVETNFLSDEAQECQNLLIDVQKFEQRFNNFKQIQAVELAKLEEQLEESFKFFDANIIGNLKIAENFVKDIEDTTAAQKEEVDILKEKILYQFSNLEYAKTLLEHTKDLRYMHLLRSQPLDPLTLARFQKIEKLHTYIRNQVTEGQRFFYYNKPEVLMPKRQQPTTAQYIYQTLANHSQILCRQSQEIEKARNLLKPRSKASTTDWFKITTDLRATADEEPKLVSHSQIKSPKSNTKLDAINLEDLVSGIRAVKLDKDSGTLSGKPVLFRRKKVAALAKWLNGKPKEIKCDIDFMDHPVMSVDSLHEAINEIEKDKEKDVGGAGDRIKILTSAPPQSQSSNILTPLQQATVGINQHSATFSILSEQTGTQSISFLSASPKGDHLQSGDSKLTGTVHPLPTSIDPSMFSSTPVRPFCSVVSSSTLASSTNINLNPLKFSAFAPTDGSTDGFNKSISFSTDPSGLDSINKLSESNTTKSQKPLATTLLSGIVSQFPPSQASNEFTTTKIPSSVFGGNTGIFGQPLSASSTSSPTVSIVLGGVPPSVTVKSVTPLKVSSSSSSFTSEESAAELKSTASESLTMLSTPKSNVGLWGVSTGAFSSPPLGQQSATPTTTPLKVHSPAISFSTSSSAGGNNDTNVSPLLTTQLQKSTITSPSFSAVSPLPTSPPSSILPVKTEEDTLSSIASTTETIKSTPAVTVATIPPNKSIFGVVTGTSLPPITVSSQATIASSTSFLSSALSPSPVFSSSNLFGVPSTSLGSAGIFGSGGLFSTPATGSGTNATTSIFGGSLPSPSTTTTGTTQSFSPTMFSGSQQPKSIFGGGAGVIITPVPTAVSTTTSTTQPQTTSSLFSTVATAATTAPDTAMSMATTVPTTTTSTLFSGTAISPTSIFRGVSFGNTAPGATVTTTGSIFGTPAATVASTAPIFGATTSMTPSSSSTSVFGAPETTTTSSATMFGTLTPSTPSSAKSIFGTSTSASGVTTIPTAPLFGTPTTTNGSLFETPTTAPTATSLFGTPTPTTTVTTGSLFGTPTPATTAATTGSLFGTSTPATTTTSTGLLFSTPTPATTAASIFGTPTPSTTTASTGSLFGTPSASVFGSPFGSTPTTTPSRPFGDAATPVAQSPFGISTSVTAGAISPFGGVNNVAPNQNPFGSPSTTNTTSIFGGAGNNNAASPFGGTSVASPSPFGGSTISAAAPTSPFGTSITTSTASSSIFGQSQQASVFGGSGTTSSTVFGGSGAFGSPSAQQNTTSVFGQSSSSNAFGGKPAFGSPSAFGSATPFGSTQQPSSGSIFGQSSFGSPSSQPESIFGGSSFGLGAKPSADGASRNVFGNSSTYAGSSSPGLFGSGSGTSQLGSGSALSPGTGAFSSGGAGVAQTGFGAASAKPAVGGFGSSPSFGSAPAFGNTPFGPAFGSTGSSPAFGGGTTNSGSIFGGGTVQSGPTFGALAQSSNQPTFGGFAQSASTPFGQPQQQQQPAPSFGGGTSFSSWR